MKNQTVSEQPWYKNGLRFTCTQCGDCCTGAPGYVWFTEEEGKKIADFVGVSIGEFHITHTKLVGGRKSLREFANGDCTFFDGATRRCKIYPVRPAQCQTWPFWKSNLENEATWNEVVQVCPGAGCGELVPLSEITSRSEVVEI